VSAPEAFRYVSRRRMSRRALIAGSVAAALASVSDQPARAAPRGRWWRSLIFGVLENHSFNQVANLPSHRRLFREGTVLTRYFAVTHPSGPNYRALISGATWSKAQTIDVYHPSIAGRAAELSPPVPTYVYHLSGTIARRHNPFLDLRAPVTAVRQGLSTLRSDLDGELPEAALVYVGWDDEHNMHNGDRARGDRSLTALLDVLAASAWFGTPDSAGRYPALFLCYDEDDGGEGNRVFAAWWGRGVRQGVQSTVRHTHFSFCRTVTDNWGAAPLAEAGAASVIAEAWV
jgi:phosphatidylinositol-3-phosphatase